MVDYEKHAKSLAKPLLELLETCIIKQHIAILEELQTQLKERDVKIKNLEKTLSTCIAWQTREFGEQGVNQLLQMLNIEA